MDIGTINTIIFNTIFKDAAAVASNGGYTINKYHYNLFDTDMLNGGVGKIDPTISDKTEMMYTLDGSKNYVFVGVRGLNVIPSANLLIESSDLPSASAETTTTATIETTTTATIETTTATIAEPISEVIILYSKSYLENVREVIARHEKYVFFKDMYEEVSAGLVIYEELFIKIEKYFQSVESAIAPAISPKTVPTIAPSVAMVNGAASVIAPATTKSTITESATNITNKLNQIQLMLDEADEDLFLVSKFSERFQIPKEVAKFNINLVKMGYSEYYTENKSFNLYVDYIYNYILKLTIEEYVYLNDNNKVQQITDICYKEFLDIQKDVLQIGEVCEFILYFIGKYKQLTKQTCGTVFGTYFGNVFKKSPIHIAKKKQLIDLTNRAKLEQAKMKTKSHENVKKLQMLRKLITTVDEEIVYIKELYKLQFFTIIHSFIEYPLMVTYFKRKINTDNEDNLLHKLDKQLRECTVQNYIHLFPSLMENFITLTQEEREVGCSFITDVIYPNKKLEDIEISPKRGNIVENIIYSLYEIENTDKEINMAKNIAFILYVSIYFYL
jgi:hypothetical protein